MHKQKNRLFWLASAAAVASARMAAAALMGRADVKMRGSGDYPSSCKLKPNVDRNHPCYSPGGPNVRMLWPASRGTYVRAVHGEIGGAK